MTEIKGVTSARTRRRLAGVCIGALAIATLAACGDDKDSSSGASGMDKVAYGIVGTPPVWDSMTPYVADQEGFFKKYNIDVSFKTFPGGVDDAKALSTNQIDMGPSPVFQSAIIVAKGGKITAVAGQPGSDYVVGSTDPALTDCASLKGQTIGVDATGGVTYTTLDLILKSCGLTIDDVKTVNFGTAIVQPVAQGQVKTAVLHVDEAAQIEALAKEDVHTVVALQDAAPLSYYAFTSVSDDFLTKRRDVAVRATAAYIEAVRWMMDPANVDAFAKLAAEKTGEEIDVATAAAKKYVELKFWPTDSSGLVEENLNATVQNEIAKGDITADEAPTAADVFDQSVYDDALKLVDGGASSSSS